MNIVMMGTPDFAVPILHALLEVAPACGAKVVGVVSQPDRPKGRKQVLTPPPLKVAALEAGLPVIQPERVKVEEAMEAIRSWQPDLIVTAAYGQLLPPALLEMPTYGCVNVHASLLPKYRGGAPIHWSIMNGEAETGVTIMHMARGLDTGDMIVQRAISIGPKDTTGTMHDQLATIGSELVREILPKLLDGSAPRHEQDHQRATYGPNISRTDERIDWHRPAQAIDCQVRGLNPWPVAFSDWNDQVLKIWEAEPVDQSDEVNQLIDAAWLPGTVAAVDTKGMLITTGEGLLRLIKVQPSGKTAMSAADFARGYQLKPGMQLFDTEVGGKA